MENREKTLLNQRFRDLWHTSLNEMGGKYAIWALSQYPPSTEIQLLDNQHIRIATAKRMRPLFQYRTLFVPARRKESAGRKVFHSDIGKQLMNSQITETVFFQQSQGVTPYPLPATGFIHHNPTSARLCKGSKNIDPQSPPPAGSRFLSSGATGGRQTNHSGSALCTASTENANTGLWYCSSPTSVAFSKRNMTSKSSGSGARSLIPFP